MVVTFMLTGIKQNIVKWKIISGKRRLYIGLHNEITLNEVYYKHGKGHVVEKIEMLIVN